MRDSASGLFGIVSLEIYLQNLAACLDKVLILNDPVCSLVVQSSCTTRHLAGVDTLR